ncbi:major facilitator superfamily transporter [Pseudomassariella vexata]|uniref:Major facilitator superfamily transporter n=1 Tax=Pseudomassariella vexata TaxID=1141098 RepID=A0A1Y2E312_9PEZI|nr:major facilitator superfamily transporter [Pseudomassariella vexata]ORY65933.1 major facilitator superfamily transporter [Pseudomassariella vexata]
MSLHRVGSLETFLSIRSEDGGRLSRRDSLSSLVSASDRARKLSFNPLPESWDPIFARDDAQPHLGQSVGAFEVPKWKRILQVVVTVIYCFFAAGVVFGYAALKPVLKKEGAYHDVCDGEDTCVEIHLNLMFTVAAVSTNVAALPIGAILDNFGPRLCGSLGAIFLAIGALLMSFAQRVPFDGFLVGYLFLALGGPFTYISSFQLSNAFPQNSGLILALLTGAFDASSALFLVYRVVFESTGGAFGHQKFFLVYLLVPAVILILQFTILPAQSYKTVGEMIEDIQDPEFGNPYAPSENAVDDQLDEQTALLREEQQEHREVVVQEIEELIGSTKADKQAQREEKKNERSGVWGVMHNYNAWQQIKSWWFWLICLFTVVQMTRINYFVATVRPQYEAIFHSGDKAVEVNNFFDLALPLGGLISIPFIGHILDHFTTVTVLTTLVSVATAIGILGVLPYMWAAYLNVCLFCLYRPFYYTAVSDYSAKVFGFRTFGTVYGTIICLSGLFNFSQSGLDFLFHVVFRGDPVPVNLILLSLGLSIGVALVSYVGWNVRKTQKKTLAREAELGTS